MLKQKKLMYFHCNKGKNIFLLIIAIIYATQVSSQTNRLLLVGDSWAGQQFTSHIHTDVFNNNGLTNISVVGDTTTIGGSRSSQWIRDENLQLISNALNINPSIDTVQITLGGNDILSLWNSGYTLGQENILFEGIQLNLLTLIEFILNENPRIEIVLSFYDYPNFEDTLLRQGCANIFNNMQQPSTERLNSIFIDFEEAISEIVNNNPRVYFVSHLGLLQNFYGFPDENINPNDIQLPGDITLPSPVESLRHFLNGEIDCIHLSNLSYSLIIQNLYDNYFYNRFEEIFSNGFE